MGEEAKPVRIVVDHREQASVIQALKARPGFEVTVGVLEFGDFLIGDKLAIERKSANDFGISILDKRLFSQVRAAHEAGVRLIFLLEDDPFKGVRNLTDNAIIGALSYLCVIEELTVLNIPRGHLVEAVARMGQHATNGLGYEVNLREARPKDPRDAALYLLQGLPGIGRGKAEALLRHFGSPGAVLTASVKDLTGCEGIGPKVAQTIRAALEQHY